MSFLTRRWFILTVTLFITLALAVALWHMGFWPSDEKDYYVDAANLVPSLKYLSEIHPRFADGHFPWLFGKEIFFLILSWFQGLMGDHSSVRPIMLMCLLSISLSAILVYETARKLWGRMVGAVLFFIFVSTLWPYLYVLFTKHQTVGLLFFLCAAFSVTLAKNARIKEPLFFLGGIFFGLSFYSSTVSTLYAPYLFGLAVWLGMKEKETALQRSALLARWLMAAAVGTTVVFIYVNYPSASNFQGFIEYVKASKDSNHFYYNQPILQQWLPGVDVGKVRAGLSWVIKYFLLVMPVVFLVYLTAAVYLIRDAFQNRPRLWRNIAIVILGLSTVILAELRGVAQYGANYFTAFAGILITIGYALSVICRGGRPVAGKGMVFIAFLAVIHLIASVWTFATDIYPSRMTSAFISDYIKTHKITRLYSYPKHPLRYHTLEQLDSEVLKTLSFTPIQTVYQALDGYIFLPPTSKDTVFLGMNSDYADFDADLVLNHLWMKGKIREAGVASFKTVGSSLIWQMEEENLAYRFLERGLFRGDTDKNRVWILDGRKLPQLGIGPDPDGIEFLNKDIRQIGTKENLFYTFRGYRGALSERRIVKALAARVYKVGEPADGLAAHLYKAALEHGVAVWVPAAKAFMSKPVGADGITSDREGTPVSFEFETPVTLEPGLYYVAIHRTGNPSDQNFYRIYQSNIGRIEAP